MPQLYTRKGDGGTSGLFGTTERFPKDSPIYEALGAVDELNSLLGVCYAVAERRHPADTDSIRSAVRAAQEKLFIIQAELAGAEKKILPQDVRELEDTIARLESAGINPHSFIIPGATELSAFFDYARATSRRTERAVIAARSVRPLSADAYAYLNRVSSLLYALARFSAKMEERKELTPSY